MLDDDTLLLRFEALELQASDFRHVDHIRLAFAILAAEADFGRAAIRFRTALIRFAEAAGATGKYHETLTWAYLALVHERMAGDAYASSLELLAAHPDLADHKGGALARYYDLDAITASPLARRVFVLPAPRGEGARINEPR